MELTTVRAVLLDMDGTLVDSDASVERAWTTWSGEHGLDPVDVLAIVHGSPPEPTVRRLLPALDDAAVAASAQRQMDLQYDDIADVVAAPGAPELLAALDRLGLPWGGFPVVPVGCAVVAPGTLAVAVPNAPVPVVVGLVVAGLGTAAFYPVTLARLVRAPGMSVTRGPAFGALASGTAILVAPVVLAALGAALDLRAAYLLAVLPLAAALAVAARREPSWS